MRFVLILLAVPAWAQMHARGSAPLPFRGAPAPAAVRPLPARPIYRGGLGYGYGYGGYGYWGNSAMIPVPYPAAEPKPTPAPALVSSSLYHADKGQPSLKEYGELPAATVAPAGVAALVAFRDGRVEPVAAYWIEGESFAYVAAGDVVKKVPATTVDTTRSESLNRQRGVTFHLPSPK